MACSRRSGGLSRLVEADELRRDLRPLRRRPVDQGVTVVDVVTGEVGDGATVQERAEDADVDVTCLLDGDGDADLVTDEADVRPDPDVADVFEFMSLTGVRWGEARALRVQALSVTPIPQLLVERSHSDRYGEKDPKSWRGTRPVPLSPRALEIFKQHARGKTPDDYLFTNRAGNQLAVGVVRKFALGFERHNLRHFAASTWLRLGTPVHEVAEYLGDDPRTVLAVYAHVLGEDQRRAHADRLAHAEGSSSSGDPWLRC